MLANEYIFDQPGICLMQFQEACCLAAVERVAVFANPETLVQVGFHS